MNDLKMHELQCLAAIDNQIAARRHEALLRGLLSRYGMEMPHDTLTRWRNAHQTRLASLRNCMQYDSGIAAWCWSGSLDPALTIISLCTYHGTGLLPPEADSLADAIEAAEIVGLADDDQASLWRYDEDEQAWSCGWGSSELTVWQDVDGVHVEITCEGSGIRPGMSADSRAGYFANHDELDKRPALGLAMMEPDERFELLNRIEERIWQKKAGR